ncbi:MAG TPA: ADOP family duplicated permease [Vicinamibacterales bacterium]|nr:ADOP family duplicated permease [Vicinamibacterales bacterium]
MAMAMALAAALRNLGRAPAFTGLVVLTLALGIGAATAMFSVVDAVLLNPLPFAKANRLVEVWTRFEAGAARAPGATSAILAAVRQEPRLFESVAAYQFGAGTLTGAGEPQLISVAGLSPSMFAVFPAAPLHGRLFTAADATSGERVVLISERLWAVHFGRDPGVIDRLVTIDDQTHRVVGILPARFNFPESSVGAWQPIDVETGGIRRRVQLVAVLQDGVTRAQVDDRLKTLTASLRESGALPQGQYLATDVPLQVRFGQRGATALYLLLGAVAVLLLVACVNVSNLILVRASSRRGELALKLAIGAGRARLLRDAASESLVLAVAGGALGWWLAGGLLPIILGLAPENMLMLSSATGELDRRAVGFAIAITSVTCALFSVLPAWRASRIDPIDALKQHSHSSTGRRDDWWQGALVSTQIALLVVLLGAAGLLLRSFVALSQVDVGFNPDGITTYEIQMPPRYAQGGAARAFMRQVEERVESTLGLPATVVSSIPIRSGGFSQDVQPEAEGIAPPPGTLSLPIARVSADFFDVFGVRMLQGRTFVAEDGEDAIIINDVLARRYFGDRSPIGRRFKTHTTQPWLTVVGIAADVKTMGPADAIGEGTEAYLPMGPNGESSFLTLAVRSDGPDSATVQQVSRIIRNLDPRMPILSATTMREAIGDSMARPRFLASLSGAFTISALLIAAVGVYGVSAYWVTRRRRELAIRLAVGASPDRLVASVLGRALRLAVIGIAIGLAIALAGARVMSAMLFATDPRDPVTFGGIIVLLAVIAIAACAVPAVKAARIDPMTTLRAE